MALPETDVRLGGYLVGGDVAIGDGYDAGVSVYLKRQFVVVAIASAALRIDGSQTYVLQIDTVGVPVVIIARSLCDRQRGGQVGLRYDADGFACGL